MYQISRQRDWLIIKILSLYSRNLFLAAKKHLASKEQNTQKKKEELEKRLEDVSDKLGMPKKPKKS